MHVHICSVRARAHIYICNANILTNNQIKIRIKVGMDYVQVLGSHICIRNWAIERGILRRNFATYIL